MELSPLQTIGGALFPPQLHITDNFTLVDDEAVMLGQFLDLFAQPQIPLGHQQLLHQHGAVRVFHPAPLRDPGEDLQAGLLFITVQIRILLYNACRFRSQEGNSDLGVPEQDRSMNWRHKALLQNAISALPASERIYYAVQRTFGDLRSDRFDPMEWLQVAARVLQRLHSAGIPVTGKRFLEVGTGRAVGVPTGLWLCGAGKIVTVDLHRYLSPALVAASNRHIRRDPEKIKEVFKGYADPDLFQNRLDQLMAFQGDLPAFLNLIDTEWLAPADARHLSFPDDSFDFHFSYAVFEHVPGPIIRDILKEAKRLLCPEGVLLHSIDLSDHFSYSDNSITKINFLQFNDERWQRWAGNQYMYHNRLRAFEFFRLFDEEGVFIARKTEHVDAQSLEALKRGFPLDSRFKSIPLEELAITNINVVGSFSYTWAKQLRGLAGPTMDDQQQDETAGHQ